MSSKMYQAHWTYPLKYRLLCCFLLYQRRNTHQSCDHLRFPSCTWQWFQPIKLGIAYYQGTSVAVIVLWTVLNDLKYRQRGNDTDPMSLRQVFGSLPFMEGSKGNFVQPAVRNDDYFRLLKQIINGGNKYFVTQRGQNTKTLEIIIQKFTSWQASLNHILFWWYSFIVKDSTSFQDPQMQMILKVRNVQKNTVIIFSKMFSMPNQDFGSEEMCVSTEYFSAIKSDRPLARPNSST